jgi:hypothetical protein
MITYYDMLDVAKARVFRYKTPWKVWQIACVAFSSLLVIIVLVLAIMSSVHMDNHPTTYLINQNSVLKIDTSGIYVNNQPISKTSPTDTQMFVIAGFLIGIFAPILFVYYMRTSGNKERQKYYDSIIGYWLEHKELPEEKK